MVPLVAGLVAFAVLAVGVIVVLAFTLGRDSGEAAPTAPPVRLDSPQAIAARLAELGMPCANLSPISNPIGAVARSSCYVGTDEVTISVYESKADVEAQWNMHKALILGESKAALVVGDIWTLNPDDHEWGRRAAEKLGAEFRTTP